ncbi:hypothetical protein PENTCL1PPCAC_15496, partial [Pristionchus entomophagus]
SQVIALLSRMKATSLILLLTQIHCAYAFWHKGEPEEKLDLKGIIERWEYPVEVHQVTTSDGYILDLFRIPRGRNERKSSEPCTRHAILFNHGLALSGAQWALNMPNQSAAFVFADAGFDVFLLNQRGTTYGRKHTKMGSGFFNNEFWQFTLDEMANSDVPAVIDKVLALNGNKQLYYVGHNQGNLVGFMMLADNPQYNRKVKKLFALAPVGAVHYAKGAVRAAFLIHNIFRPITALYTSVLGAHEIFFNPFPWLYRTIVEFVCKKPLIGLICKDVVDLTLGHVGPQLNVSRTPVYFSHVPSGSSTWTFLHYAQNAQAKKAMHFDYGNPLKNFQKHGRVSIWVTPHPYNYSQIDTEIYLFWSRNDWLATPNDIVHPLIPSLGKGVIKGSFEFPEYNHLHYAVATTTKERVYQPIIDIIVKDGPMPMCAGES